MNTIEEVFNLLDSLEVKFIKVSDAKMTDEDSFLSRQRDDQSKEPHHEGANLDQPCDQRDHVWHTLRRHWAFSSRPVSTEMLTIAACTNVNLFKEFKSARQKCPRRTG